MGNRWIKLSIFGVILNVLFVVQYPVFGQDKPPKGTITLYSSNISIKTKPSPFSPDLGVTSNKGPYNWYEREGAWYQIIYDNQKGYIYDEYIEEVVDFIEPEQLDEPTESASDAESAVRRDITIEKVQSSTESTEALLRKADGYIEEYKLTSPQGENAYEIYDKILQQYPNNEIAKAGLTKIADRYYELAQKHLRKNEIGKSNEYIQKGLNVKSDHENLQNLFAQIESESVSEKMNLTEETEEETFQEVLPKQESYKVNRPSKTASEWYEIGKNKFFGLNNHQINDKEAYDAFLAASEQNHPESTMMTGYMSAIGLGVNQDSVFATKQFEKAAKQGELTAKYYFGLSLIHGYGTPVNSRKGASFIQDAGRNKYNKAYKVLSRLYREGIGIERSQRESIKWDLKYTGSELNFLIKDIALGHKRRVMQIPDLEKYYFEIVKLR